MPAHLTTTAHRVRPIFTPGAVVTEPTSFQGQNAIERSTNGGGQVAVNGNRQQANNFLLDGIEINETINNTIGYNPSPDALDQVRTISANAQAEYGNVNGGDVIALIKSGTNRFHGYGFYYASNYNLDANSWANNLNGPPRTAIPATSLVVASAGPFSRIGSFSLLTIPATATIAVALQLRMLRPQRCVRVISASCSTPV